MTSYYLNFVFATDSEHGPRLEWKLPRSTVKRTIMVFSASFYFVRHIKCCGKSSGSDTRIYDVQYQ